MTRCDLVQWLIVPSTVLRAGDRVGPFELPLDPELVRQFADATLDDDQQVRDGQLVPPSFIATQVYRAQLAAIAELVPDHVFSTALSGVHGQHDLLVHRPVASDQKLHTFVETHSARPSGDNLRVTLHHFTLDDRDDLVAEQWWTTVLLGTTADPTGPDLPDYSFSPNGAALVAEDVVRIDEVMARRYAQVSGDYSDHHFSVEGARRSGYEAPFLHGLCTMALCTRAATKLVAGCDPRRIRRAAVRFAAPAFLGRDLCVQIFDHPDGGFALEARSGKHSVIKNGRFELVP
ncbi:MAG TPA: MaoC/PaaZ C-terminal domain-containing protein [Acidimicrobiales bacterium]|nr:MaoC/PaaZ C-terminal domain-containing protein [Acidimicrobiales bacterium]